MTGLGTHELALRIIQYKKNLIPSLNLSSLHQGPRTFSNSSLAHEFVLKFRIALFIF
jgi:hypothetical protein